jgi:hypothetical protein
MNRALLPPALLSAAFLCAAITEMLATPVAVHVAPPRIARASAAVAPVRAADTGHEGETILARPLFTANRRPAAAKTGTVATKTPPRLSAILISSSGKAVLFDDGGKPLIVHEGGRAGPYVVMSISADRIGVMSPEGQRTLRPTPIPSDQSGDNPATGSTEPAQGLSLLQQLQRGQVPHYAVPPPPTIQNLIARMRAQH